MNHAVFPKTIFLLVMVYLFPGSFILSGIVNARTFIVGNNKVLSITIRFSERKLEITLCSNSITNIKQKIGRRLKEVRLKQKEKMKKSL
jgi:hypothetical protein